MADDRDIRDFKLEERSNSLSPDPPEKRYRDEMKRKSKQSGMAVAKKLIRDPKFASSEIGKPIAIELINTKLKTDIKAIKDKALLEALYSSVLDDCVTIDTHPTLSKIVKQIDEKMEGSPTLIKFFVSKTFVYGWIGARHGIPKFKAVEKILDGIQKKEIKEVTEGVVEFAGGKVLSTILLKLIRSRE